MLMWKLIKENLTGPNRKGWTLHLLIGYQLHPSDSVSARVSLTLNAHLFQWLSFTTTPRHFLLFPYKITFPLLYLLDSPIIFAMAYPELQVSAIPKGFPGGSDGERIWLARWGPWVQSPDWRHLGPRDSAWETGPGFTVYHAFNTYPAYNLSSHYMPSNLQGWGVGNFSIGSAQQSFWTSNNSGA